MSMPIIYLQVREQIRDRRVQLYREQCNRALYKGAELLLMARGSARTGNQIISDKRSQQFWLFEKLLRPLCSQLNDETTGSKA